MKIGLEKNLKVVKTVGPVSLLRQAREIKVRDEMRKAKKQAQEKFLKEKSCPQSSPGFRPVADNVGLWINGWNELELAIEKRIYKYKVAIQRLTDSTHAFVQKERKGKMYWYQLDGRDWIYKGKEDPREEIKLNILDLTRRKQHEKDLMLSVIEKRFEDALLIDIVLFEQRVCKRLPSNVIRVSEILEAAQFRDNRLREFLLKAKRGKK